MKKILVFYLFCFRIFTSYSQDTIDFYNYSPLICKGTIPEDFKVELSDVVENARQKQNGRSPKEIKQAVVFAELSYAQLNNILYSGKVLYGDALTEYVNKVADVVLKDNNDLRGKLKFYVLKSTDLNAFSTQSGIIFVSAGLLAQIETEAQLAFILCHEIVHFRNNHHLQIFKRDMETPLMQGEENMAKRIKGLMTFSKENELIADREGLDFFLKTPYGTNELNDLFDVMLYSYLPFDEISFDTAYFESEDGYELPPEYFLPEVANITAEENAPDSLSTHPNIKKRRKVIQSLLKKRSNSGGVSFVNSEELFKQIQKIARYEITLLNLQNGELEQAIYNGYLIEKVYGRSLFTDKVIAGALYIKGKQKTFANYKQKHFDSYFSEYFDNLATWRKIEGESQAVYYLLYQIPPSELNIMAARKLYECYQLYNDSFFKKRFNSVIHDLVNSYDLSKSDFFGKEEYSPQSEPTHKIDYDTLHEPSTKIDRIKKAKAKQSKRKVMRVEDDTKYYQYGFYEYFHDTALIECFNKCMDQKAIEADKDKLVDRKNYELEKERLIHWNGQSLNADSIVLINPFFSQYITKVSPKKGVLTSYEMEDPGLTPLNKLKVEHKILSGILENAKELELKVNVLGATQRSNIDTDKFNEYQQMANWISEHLEVGAVETHSDQYINNHFSYIGFCQVIKVDRELGIYFILYDMRTGKADLVLQKMLSKGKPDGNLVKNILYDVLLQIKQDDSKLKSLKKRYGITD